MSHRSHRPSVPAHAPSLAEVHKDPTILDGLPLPVIVNLRRQVSHLAADLDAAFLNAMAQASKQDDHPKPDRLLTPEAAAERFGVTKRWLLDHADEIPGVKRPKGTPNRATKEVRELARWLVEDPNYLQSLRQRLVGGRAPHMETLLFRYAYGKPKDLPEGPPGRPCSFSSASPTATTPWPNGKGQVVQIGQTGPEALPHGAGEPRGTHAVVDDI